MGCKQARCVGLRLLLGCLLAEGIFWLLSEAGSYWHSEGRAEPKGPWDLGIRVLCFCELSSSAVGKKVTASHGHKTAEVMGCHSCEYVYNIRQSCQPLAGLMK